MWRAILVLAVMLAAGCAPVAPRVGMPSAQWHPSPNFDARRPTLVVIHHTSNDSAEPALRTLTDPARAVSAHYVIGRDGRVYQLVDERMRAWHAGESSWGGEADVNSRSIGIELDNNGREPFADAQIAALLGLLGDLKARYAIPAANFVGHGDVAPGRKVDPSAFFPWRVLASRGFGLWCDPPAMDFPADFDAILALQALGYEVSDPDAAMSAFNRHYLGLEDSRAASPQAKQMMACLVERKALGD